MNLQHRIELLVRLGGYILSEARGWQLTKERAEQENGWFVPAFIDLAAANIARQFLQKDILEDWAKAYAIPEINSHPREIGLVMAGNIPLVGFHDLLAVLISGQKAVIKPSSKDRVLIQHLADILQEWAPELSTYIRFADMLKGCHAYIATGSNQSARHFDYYFNKYPHIIRRNRTSVALLNGQETPAQLESLADDVHQFFGLGCRNVTQLYVPEGYDFVPLLETFRKYTWFADHHKYKNNFDYNLALHLLNNQYYMSNAHLLLVEYASPFSPISQLNYQFYTQPETVIRNLQNNTDIQAVIGMGALAFGQAQCPGISDYADGADTLRFLLSL
jgi:Acyl-CoA reductase (LuxC)